MSVPVQLSQVAAGEAQLVAINHDESPSDLIVTTAEELVRRLREVTPRDQPRRDTTSWVSDPIVGVRAVGIAIDTASYDQSGRLAICHAIQTLLGPLIEDVAVDPRLDTPLSERSSEPSGVQIAIVAYRPVGRVPDAWLRCAAEQMAAWSSDGLAVGQIAGRGLMVSDRGLPPLLSSVNSAAYQVRAACHRSDRSIGAVAASYGQAASIAIGVVFPFESVEWVAEAEALIEVSAPALAEEAAYVALAVQDEHLTLDRGGYNPPAHGFAFVPSEAVEPYLHDVVVDAFPWQLLGPGHLAALDAEPNRGRLAELTGLRIGELADWQPGTPARQATYGSAVKQLRPILLDWTDWRQRRHELHQKRKNAMRAVERDGP